MIQGEPDDPAGNGFFFDGDADFQKAGIGISRNDQYMDLWLADFNAPETGSYKFKMDQRDDFATIWVDLDQNGIFETTGSAGNEKMGGNNNFTSINQTLVGGQTYKIALAHGEGGAGSSFRAWVQTPSLSERVINPMEAAQNGLFTNSAHLIYNTVFSSMSDSPQSGYGLHSKNGKFEFRTGPGWLVDPQLNHNNDAWYHVGMTYDGTTKRIYLNGTTAGESVGDRRPKHRYPTSDIGSAWDGLIDELRISSTVRSVDWMQASFDNQKAASDFVVYGNVTSPRVITSPLNVSAMAGQPFDYNVTASGSPFSHAAFNLPGGLQFDASTGVVTGTPTVAGVFPVSLLVYYLDDDGDLTDPDSLPDVLGTTDSTDANNQVVLHLTITATSPVVATSAATAAGPGSASFNGNLTEDGGEPPTIRIYHGTTDGGTDASAWADAIDVGNKRGRLLWTVARRSRAGNHLPLPYAGFQLGCAHRCLGLHGAKFHHHRIVPSRGGQRRSSRRHRI